ncbi:hypothetical protein BZA05DRAFT_414757 [Tricharina praecox]|uniref:uncharacterized protein n=1 Tax=Tricharina praecox TaxID=43433 RepID=UPI002220D9A4|nr:uncharacterized protein BZA05DRAFT_414757 [Tricharina praecox]KAI5859015.1 hypothetical protein BZA05DRAFT_414757 [Tricharina praecox]
MAPLTPSSSSSHQKTPSQAMIPMWDSSDPARNPPPLPLRPHGPGSPISSSGASGVAPDLGYESPNSSREVSPVRRPRSDSFGAGGVLTSPKRAVMPPTGGSSHIWTNSTAPSNSVREIRDMILSGQKPETSPTRGVAPSPRDLFGSSASFPLKDREILQPREQYSSLSFRKSLDFDKAPALTPLRNNTTSPEPSTPKNAVTRSGADYDDAPGKVTVHDIHTISSQLSGITTIATNLQREMTNLSRRSKDNATDLMALKEAAKNRDEDIRRSLRDLQSGLTSFEATDRLLEGRHSHLSMASGSDRGSNYGDDAALMHQKYAAASTQTLEKILREMPTKQDQDRALEILQDIQDSLKAQQDQEGGKGDAEAKILTVLEEIRDRESSRGKELALVGARSHDDDERVLAMLEELRRDLHQEKPGEERIMSILEEIREKDVEERSDARILLAIDEIKGRDADERLDQAVSILEELRDRDADEKVMSMIEEVRAKLEVMSEDMGKQPTTTAISSSTSLSEPTPIAIDGSVEVLDILRNLQEGVGFGGALGKEIKRLVEDWREIWIGHDKSVGDALKDLGGQIEVLAAVQRAAMARMPSHGSLGLPSQALTTTNPPLPPDLDNEAAITALANIASTTTRTDITLSSINALIKVFQKESYHANNHNTEGLATLGRFLEEIGQAVGTANAATGDVRKVLEVVRTGVCSGNDRLAEFEDNTSRKIDELTHLHKHLQRSIMGDDDEALWKVDLGVKDDVDELTRKVEELFEKNTETMAATSAETLEAIANSNPAMLIAELKGALGAMAQRSLDAFNKSEDAIQQLKEATETSADRNIEAIQAANSAVALADFRTEFKEMAEKTYAICQVIDAKSGSEGVGDILAGIKSELAVLIQQSVISESTEITSAIDRLREELDAKMEDTLTTAVALASADEKTSAALAELRSEVNETLSKAVTRDDSAKILEPIRELRHEILDMIEKSNSAMAAPVHYPEADEIKIRIERLSRELMDAMVKTADLVAESAMSSGDSGQQIKETVETLRKDIGAMGSSIAAAVASNSAIAVEDGINGAFEDMKETVLAKVEQSLVTSDKAVSCIADLSQQTRDSITDLKKEVLEMMNKSISMAVATVTPSETGTNNKSLLDALEGKITDVIISTMAASSSSDEIKELIESLKTDIDGMGKQIVTPTPGSDETIKKLLREMKEDVTSIVSSASSQDTKKSIDQLRHDVQEMMQKSSSMISPAGVLPIDPTAAKKVEEAITSLKEDVNEMLEKSLAVAIAESTFDSEEKVKEAIEELKRDVKDTLEKSMVPLPQQANHESSRMVREAMEVLRQDLSSMLDKRAIGETEDREDMVKRLDALKGQFGELLEKSTNVEVKEAVDILKIQVHGLLEKSMGAEYAELKDMLKAINGQVIVREPMPADDEVNVILEALRIQVEELASKLAEGDVSVSMAGLQAQVEKLSKRPVTTADNTELKEAIEALKSHIEGLQPKTSSDLTVLNPSAEELKAAVEESTSNLSTANDVLVVKTLVEEFKGEFAAAMEKHSAAIHALGSAGALEALKVDLQTLLVKPIASLASSGQPAAAGDTQVKEVKDALEQLRKEVKEMVVRSSTRPLVSHSIPSSTSAATPESMDLKEAVSDISSAVGECRVEVAIVKALLEEKSSETSGRISGLTKSNMESYSDTRETISNLKGVVFGVKEVIEGYRHESRDDMADVKEVVNGLQTTTADAVAATVSAISDFRADAKSRVSEVKVVMDSVREETKDGFEEVNKTVEGAQVELREVIAGVDRKIDSLHEDVKEVISEVLTAVNDSMTESQSSFVSLTTSMETTVGASQAAVKEDISVIKKLVEESQSTNETAHGRTQQQVAEVLGLVDGLQAEWKEQQPTLYDALLEMKQLLLAAQEAQRALAEKPDVELPPPYDDSRAQDKLDQLIEGTANQAKYLPQLDLLDTIQMQVSATSASISELIEQQKSQALDEAAVKVEAARQAEFDLEKAISDKRLVEAATERLRDEHDKLQVSVGTLRNETKDLSARKVKLVAELAGVETTLKLRREEMDMMEVRSAALQQRMMDGVLERSRKLLETQAAQPKKASPKKAPKLRSLAGLERRHFSQSHAGIESPTSKAVRPSYSGGIGLGQRDYSSNAGALGRSQSVKTTFYSTSRKADPVIAPEILEPAPAANDDMEFDEEYYPEPELESEEEEGSVIRNPSEDRDDDAAARKAYPALNLDFGGGARSVSGVSSVV